MKNGHFRPRRRARRVVATAVGCVVMGLLPTATVFADDGRDRRDDSQSRIQRGFEISPIPPSQLNMSEKNRALVGLGSYIVNTGGCNDCHTHRAYALGGDPFQGQPAQVNVAQYMAGGRSFPPSPFVAANLTPDAQGRPAGLTFDEFRVTMQSGHNPLDPPGTLLQVMPWPSFGTKTDRDLRAIYEYLSAIPSLPDNPNPGPEP